jgi:cytoskeletal protein RodZ
MKTAGSIIREERVRRGISLEKAEAATRIRKKFLIAIEQDDYSVLPSLLYAKGFIKNYSEYLGLDSGTVLAFYRRQTDEGHVTTLPKKDKEAFRSSWSQLTPSRFVGLLVSILIVLFFAYFITQYRRLSEAPLLIIEKPSNNVVVKERKIDIMGKTDNDATVTINGVTALVRPDGSFFDQMTLEVGVNSITISAISRYGKTTTLVRKVGLQQ